MAYILSSIYRILSIPVLLLMAINILSATYIAVFTNVGVFLGVFGSLYLVFFFYWIITSIMLLILSRKVVKNRRFIEKVNSIDEELVEASPIEAFPNAVFLTISSIISALALIWMLSGSFYNLYEDFRNLSNMGKYYVFPLYIVLAIHAILQVIHASWLLNILRRAKVLFA